MVPDPSTPAGGTSTSFWARTTPGYVGGVVGRYLIGLRRVGWGAEHGRLRLFGLTPVRDRRSWGRTCHVMVAYASVGRTGPLEDADTANLAVLARTADRYGVPLVYVIAQAVSPSEVHVTIAPLDVCRIFPDVGTLVQGLTGWLRAMLPPSTSRGESNAPATGRTTHEADRAPAASTPTSTPAHVRVPDLPGRPGRKIEGLTVAETYRRCAEVHRLYADERMKYPEMAPQFPLRDRTPSPRTVAKWHQWFLNGEVRPPRGEA